MKLHNVFLVLILSALFVGTACNKQSPDEEYAMMNLQVKYDLDYDEIDIVSQGLTETGDVYYEFTAKDHRGFLIDLGDEYSVVDVTNEGIYYFDKISDPTSYNSAKIKDFLVDTYGPDAVNYSVHYRGITSDQCNYWQFQGMADNGYVVEHDTGYVIEDEVDGI